MQIHKSCFVAFSFLALGFGLLVYLQSCRKAELWEESTEEWFSGGQQTVFDHGSGAFSSAFPIISQRNSFVHEVGDLAFEQTFVSNGIINPGLGPLYNSVSCTSCHIADGRGTPVGPGPNIISLLFRISIPGNNIHGGPLEVPGFGNQLQQNAISGIDAEASMSISYTESEIILSDGSTVSLRTPVYTIENAYANWPANAMISPRIAPPVFGLGLLEAISEQDILVHADEYDIDLNGISGKPNYVWDVLSQQHALGRFGWKCGAPSLLQQTAGAYNEDMGITNFIFPKESSHSQIQQEGDLVQETELSDSLLHAVSHYVATLAVPARRDLDAPIVQRGKEVFMSSGCADCHQPSFRTEVNVAFPEVSNQLIFPYSDMLLHDMGEGLSDGRTDFLATGNEWRTAPLWGIGLTDVVNGHNNFLHDGRARSLLEAVLWHGGEAENSKNKVIQLTTADREALIAFLESL